MAVDLHYQYRATNKIDFILPIGLGKVHSYIYSIVSLFSYFLLKTYYPYVIEEVILVLASLKTLDRWN